MTQPLLVNPRVASVNKPRTRLEVMEMMGFDGYGMSGWMWLYGALVMLLFWGGLAGLIVWAVRTFSRPSNEPDSAQEVLKHRFAAGEISPEDYETTRHALLR